LFVSWYVREFFIFFLLTKNKIFLHSRDSSSYIIGIADTNIERIELQNG